MTSDFLMLVASSVALGGSPDPPDQRDNHSPGSGSYRLFHCRLGTTAPRAQASRQPTKVHPPARRSVPLHRLSALHVRVSYLLRPRQSVGSLEPALQQDSPIWPPLCCGESWRDGKEYEGVVR